jgi:L-histidine Nalpha-methyltransferase
MIEKGPKKFLEKTAKEKIQERELAKDAKRILRKSEKVGEQGLTPEERDKMDEILDYLSRPEEYEENELPQSEAPDTQKTVEKKSLGNLISDPFSFVSLLDPNLDTSIWSIRARKKALKKIKEAGFESFADIEVNNIAINEIKKLESAETAQSPLFQEEYSYVTMYGDKIVDNMEVEEIKGTVRVTCPLLSDKPIEMGWAAYISQTMSDVKEKKFKSELYWHQKGSIPVSAADIDIDVPYIFDKRAEKLGFDDVITTYGGRYAVGHRRVGLEPGQYQQVPVAHNMTLFKAYYIQVSQKVFAELDKYIKEHCFPDEAINPDYQKLSFSVNTEISQEIEKEREAEIIEGLQNRQFDEKIFYYGKGARKFLEIVYSHEYQLSNTELELIKNNIDIIKPFLQGRTLYDLGAANALKAIPMLEAQLVDQDTVDYVPVDINPAMIMAAAANIDNPKVNIEGKVIDFSKPMENKLETKPKMMALLGSTLGNGDLDFQQKLLKNISNSMTSEDFLLVGVHLKTDLSKTLAMYENPPGKDFVMTTIKNLGFPEDKIELDMQADEESRQIKVIVKIKEDLVVRRGNEKISFNQGENLTIFVSQKYEVDELNKIASKAGLEMDQSFVDDEKQYQLAIFKKSSVA